MNDYFDRDGRPITFERWARLFGDTDGRRIERTERCGVTVSTVWLGLDHSFGHASEPWIFETMIFGGPHDGEQIRTATEAAARDAHARAVRVAFG